MVTNENRRILLINPSIRSFFNKNFNILPPLVFGIISALTPKYWKITMWDENIDNDSEFGFDYDIVAITTNTVNILRSYELADIYRAKNIKVIFGGWHSASMLDEALSHADSVIIGSVESEWLKFLNDFENNEIKKVYKEISQKYEFIKADNSIFKSKYFSTAVETSRGCKNHCKFCGIHINGHQAYKRKPISLVITEITEADSDFIFFLDNNFFGGDYDYLEQLFNEMISLKLKKKWITAVSVNFFNSQKLIKLAAKSGACLLFVGFETDSFKTLKYLGKENVKSIGSKNNNIFEDYRKIVKSCHKNGILISGNIIIGFENDTEEIILNRMFFFKNLKLDSCKSVILTPLPGTAFFNEIINQKKLSELIFPNDWNKFLYIKNVIKHKNLSSEFLEKNVIYCNQTYFKQSLMKTVRSFFILKSIKSSAFFYYYLKNFANYESNLLNKLFYFFLGNNFFK